MNLQAYWKGQSRGEFWWELIESGTYGDGNAVDVEETGLNGRNGKITRRSKYCFEAEVDNLENKPFYDEKEFTSRRSARLWVERMIRKDIHRDREVDFSE